MGIERIYIFVRSNPRINITNRRNEVHYPIEIQNRKSQSFNVKSNELKINSY